MRKYTYVIVKKPTKKYSSGQNTLYDILIIIFALTIPCLVVLYAYLQIYRTFKKNKNSVHRGSRGHNTKKNTSIGIARRYRKMTGGLRFQAFPLS